MERLSKINLNEWIGRTLTLSFLVKSVEIKRTKTGSDYMQVNIVDGEKSEDIKYWRISDRMKEEVKAGVVCKADVRVDNYNGSPSLIGSSIELLPDADIAEYANILSDFDGYVNKLREFHDSIQDPFYKNIITNAFSIVGMKKFVNGVGGLSHHHTEIGGLLRHTVGVVETALTLADIYSKKYGKINRDLLIAGCILHDIGKVEEYDIDAETYTASYNPKSLMGHIPKGLGILGMAYRDVGNDNISGILNREKYNLLSHIIGSHHGTKEWDTIVKPEIIEAEIVFISDYADSRFDNYGKVLNKMEVGEFNSKLNIYKHSNLSEI